MKDFYRKQILRQKLAEFDAKLDRQVAAKKFITDPVERGVAEGVRIARELKEATARMVSAYEDFLEETLGTILNTLGCTPEDITLIKKPIEGEIATGGIFGKMEIYVKGVHVMNVIAEQFSESDYRWIAEPVELTEEEQSA